MLAFSVLWAADTVATMEFVSTLGLEAEANPLIRKVIAAYGFGGFAAVKAAALLFWLGVGKHAHLLLHVALIAIMVPVVFVGLALAYW